MKITIGRNKFLIHQPFIVKTTHAFLKTCTKNNLLCTHNLTHLQIFLNQERFQRAFDNTMRRLPIHELFISSLFSFLHATITLNQKPRALEPQVSSDHYTEPTKSSRPIILHVVYLVLPYSRIELALTDTCNTKAPPQLIQIRTNTDSQYAKWHMKILHIRTKQS